MKRQPQSIPPDWSHDDAARLDTWSLSYDVLPFDDLCLADAPGDTLSELETQRVCAAILAEEYE